MFRATIFPSSGETTVFMGHFVLVVYFILGNSPASEFYMPTFRNTLCSIFIGGYVPVYLPMKMEQTEWSETSEYKIQTPGNYPEENIQHTEHGESLKSRTLGTCSVWKIIWYAGWNPPCIPDSHPYKITSIKCRINTAVSPDDGHIVGRNM